MAHDVVVVGAGAMGAASALALAERGASVALIEQFERGHDRGSSHGPARIFRLAYPQREYVELAQRAQALWRALEVEYDVKLLTTVGGVDHGPLPLVQDVADTLSTVGVAHQWLSPTEAHERWPGLRFDDSALVQLDAARIDADATVHTLHHAAGTKGVDLEYHERVLDVRETTSGVEVATEQRTLSARVAVVAAGSWASQLLARHAVARELPPLRVTQEQPAYFATASDAQWPAFIHHLDVPIYGLPTEAGTIKVGAHGNGPVVDPDRRPDLDPDLVMGLERYVAEWLPGLQPRATTVERCLYTSTPDANFVLRRFGSVVVCSACSGHGFKFVPAVAQRVTELALQG